VFGITNRWKKSKFNSVEILSKSGGNCSLKLPNTTSLQIKDDAGNWITFVKDGQDKINFETKKSTIYYISLDSISKE
jgi:alpha-L-fucosidase 2